MLEEIGRVRKRLRESIECRGQAICSHRSHSTDSPLRQDAQLLDESQVVGHEPGLLSGTDDGEVANWRAAVPERRDELVVAMDGSPVVIQKFRVLDRLDRELGETVIRPGLGDRPHEATQVALDGREDREETPGQPIGRELLAAQDHAWPLRDPGFDHGPAVAAEGKAQRAGLADDVPDGRDVPSSRKLLRDLPEVHSSHDPPACPSRPQRGRNGHRGRITGSFRPSSVIGQE